MKKTRKPLRQTILRMTLTKKFLLGFAVTAAVTWAAFRYLSLVPALISLVVVGGVVWWLIDRLLVKPIQAITLAVIESRPTPDGFTFTPPELHTGDELELLNDALRRMTDDLNEQRHT